jgi:acyl transferase domain-containing protein
MVVLQRLEDAERDGDRIYAVIRSVGSSGDGRGKSIFAPNVAGQVKALQRAYEKTAVDPASVTMIEAHGTGTNVGDECDLTALKQYFGEHGAQAGRTVIGSVKSQIGHTRMTAGVAGLIKVALSLYHKTLPPTINVKKEHPALAGSPFYLVQSPRPWITNSQYPIRRAGLSAFGFGGANYHVVLEEYPGSEGSAVAKSQWRRLCRIPAGICLSADDPQTLAQLCQDLADEIAKDPVAYDRLLDEQLAPASVPEDKPRVGFVTNGVADAVDKLRLTGENIINKATIEEFHLEKEGIHFRQKGLPADAKTVTLFSGQGAQYLDMFSDIARDYPEMTNFLELTGVAMESRGLTPVAEVIYPKG